MSPYAVLGAGRQGTRRRPRVRAPEGVRDVVLARVVVTGRAAEATVDLEVLPDDSGFNAVERSTGGHAAIVCRFMAEGRSNPAPRRSSSPSTRRAMVAEARARGFRITERRRPLP